MYVQEYGTIKQGEPQSRDCDNLYASWDSLMFEEIGYIHTESGMVHKPVIQSAVTTQKESSCQKKQRSSRKNRKKGSQNAQPE